MGTTRAFVLAIVWLVAPLPLRPDTDAGGVENRRGGMAGASQDQSQEEFQKRILRLVGEHYDTVTLYRQGQIDLALQRLSTIPNVEQVSIVTAVYAIVKQKKEEMRALAGAPSAARRGTPQTAERPANQTPASARRWTVDLMPAAGALQMEAAIMATRRHNEEGYQEAARQMSVADLWFEKHLELTEADPKTNPARRWKLVMGLMMMSRGAFGRVVSLLGPECEKAPDDVALQIACGSAHEAIVMLPGDVTLALAGATARRVPEHDLFDDSRITRVRGVESPVAPARAMRDGNLKRARQAFESALKSDPRNVEARIRLGSVRLMERDDTRAVSLLSPLLLEPVGAREAYLARLFLSRARARAKQFDEAARILDQAARVMPSGQSAYVGLAHVQTQKGDSRAAADALQRMLMAPREPDDPWVTYRFAQYWVPDTLIRELRAEARR
jgi:tetratricopeptide (TPR) repeat protein